MGEERPARVDPERWALAVFCAALPGLRVKAAAGFWEDTLELHAGEVAEGGSAVAACRELGLTAEVPVSRGDQPGIDGAATDWLPRPALVGDYRCPLRRCPRRAGRDERGRPPRCALAEAQMLFVRRDPA